ncbi:hypothetical protein TNCV_581811 [Trichonephila clavipes]|nr:hypothetical protein TNCV_581811 [Trichonephila clavipes]
MTERRLEQRYCIKFRQKHGDSQSETIRRSQTTRNAAVVEKVENLTMKDRFLRVPKTTEQVEISTRSVHAILCDDLYMCRVAAKFVPKASVSGTQKNSILQYPHSSLRFLAVPENENAI